MKIVDYAQAPLLLIWEITRACALACQHCRASAEDVRDPRELTLDQGRNLIDQVAQMGTPLMVLTGGDPLQRDDLEDLIRHGCSQGLTMATIPAATPRLTHERILSLRDAGVHQLALSLDGETASKHDQFRRVDGTYDRVLEGAGWIREAGVPLQINTVFGAWNADDFESIAALVQSLGVAFWEIFLLVPTGRGNALASATDIQQEHLFSQIYSFSRTVDFHIKVTEGQHYRRYFAQQEEVSQTKIGTTGHRPLASRPVNAGSGFCFVDHTGEIFPSGFLPLACGNVKRELVSETYRHHRVFQELRDLSRLKGKCGRCSYRDFCSGGSRARAYALTGDYASPEAFCLYEPT